MPQYSIWVLEYAFIPEVPVASLLYAQHGSGNAKLSYGYVLIKGCGTTILVDCGYDHKLAGKKFADHYGVENWRPPTDVLKAVGLSPEDIEHIIITHAHFDHMGGLKLFPNAKFYIQQSELTHWVKSLSLDSRFRWLKTAIDPGDIIYAVELARDGRLIFIDGDKEDLFPGIDIHLAEDTHTPGSQYVVVRNDGLRESQDAYACVGDLVYRYENLTGGDPLDPHYIPIGMATGSQTKVIMTLDKIMGLVGRDYRRVIAPHEPRLADHFPTRTEESGLNVIEICSPDDFSSEQQR